MMRKMDKDEDDVETSGENELICLILRKMTLMTSFSKMTKMVVNERMEAAG